MNTSIRRLSRAAMLVCLCCASFTSFGQLLADTLTVTEKGVLPRVAGANGRWVVSWQVDKGAGAHDLYAQVFDSKGESLVGPFEIRDDTNAAAARPVIGRSHEVGIDDAGNIVVCWESTDEQTGSLGTFFRRFDSEGKAIGEVTSPFQNNRKAPYRVSVLSVAPDGHFAIAATNLKGILTEIYLPDGRLRDKHEIGVGEVAKSKIAALGLTRVGVSAGGSFALLWFELEIKMGDLRAAMATGKGLAASFINRLRTRQYDSNGDLIKEQVICETSEPLDPTHNSPVDITLSGFEFGGSVATFGDKAFAFAVPQTHTGSNPARSIIAQKLDSNGPVGKLITVAGPHPFSYFGSLSGSAIAAFPDGTFVVAWSQRKDQQSPLQGLQLHFDPSGKPVDEAVPILASERTRTDMELLDVAAIDSSNYVCVWAESSEKDGTSQIKALIKEKNSD